MKVGFTGTRHALTTAQLSGMRALLTPWDGEFHHGDCIGADAAAHELAVELGFEIVQHPPLNPSLRAWSVGGSILEPRPYLPRNHDIVDACEVLLALPSSAEEKVRSGTWSTVRFARKTHTPVYLIFPDGTIKFELNSYS